MDSVKHKLNLSSVYLSFSLWIIKYLYFLDKKLFFYDIKWKDEQVKHPVLKVTNTHNGCSTIYSFKSAPVTLFSITSKSASL